MSNQSNDNIRDKIIGLGESSMKKSYYPQLKKRIAQIEELNTTLEDKVNERTQELYEKNTTLKNTLEELHKTQKSLVESEKMAALGTLVSGIAHEINTPIGSSLTAITHFLDSVNKINELYKTDDLSQNEFENFLLSSKVLADSIYQNIKKSANLVESFKRISVEHSSSDYKNFNLYTYINDIVNTLKGKMKYHQIIHVGISKLITLYGTPGAYYQIIINLLMNSLTHGFDETKSGKIRIKAYLKEKNLILIFKDNGKGISQEDLPKIFEPFFTTNRSYGGTGLGLNLIYNIVTTQLGGTITCKSELNHGTEFKIIVPLVQQDQTQV
ncbi:sensor histidine kinase [Sulfurospirillum arcachonense]|uniref:sensor histidine kinase n=1 Tax=Sulfurospirillum arcachonense TaxID=57666 RepID=UPI000467FC05|nr:HAMP domain-containing sensor histidine kinase [Sulfurospirillum arcachonense]